MYSDQRSTDRPVLHIADEHNNDSAAMQSSLLTTGREILLRKDLYRGMGAVAATRRRGSLAAIVISTRALGPGQEDFFQYVFAGQRNIPVAYYGPKVEGATFAALAACAQPIQPQDVAMFLGIDLTEQLPGAQTETRNEPAPETTEPAAPDESSPPIEDDEFTVETSGFGPLDFAQGFDPELRLAATDEAERSLRTDDKIAAEEDSDSHHFEADESAPVPWRLNPHRPARTPPKQTGSAQTDSAQPNRTAPDPVPERLDSAEPLLTREELDALLDDDQDGTEGRNLSP